MAAKRVGGGVRSGMVWGVTGQEGICWSWVGWGGGGGDWLGGCQGGCEQRIEVIVKMQKKSGEGPVWGAGLG